MRSSWSRDLVAGCGPWVVLSCLVATFFFSAEGSLVGVEKLCPICHYIIKTH